MLARMRMVLSYDLAQAKAAIGQQLTGMHLLPQVA
jgi:hypothetical protein